MSVEIRPNRRILIVDDNDSIHEDYRRVLSPAPDNAEIVALASAIFECTGPSNIPAKFELVHATQGQEALKLLCSGLEADRPFAVAFVDMRMPPGWDGLETIEQLWKRDPTLQVVICSAHTDYRMSDITARLGRSDQLLFLRKPFHPDEVRQLALALSQKWDLAQLHVRRLEEVNRGLERELQARNDVENKLRHDATHDALTTLPNRAFLIERLKHCIERLRRDPDSGCALIFFDLDNFKLINDSYGHEVGDIVLREVSQRLNTAIRSCDTLSRGVSGMASRLGGDEFVVLLENLGDPAQAMRVAQRLRESVGLSIQLDDISIVVGASAGISLWAPGKSGETLLREADTAMYQAKYSGKGRVAIFDQQMHAAVLNRLTMESDIRRAIDRQEFFVEYQPIVDIESGRIVGLEALARWNHPDRGRILPDQFITVAEESGQIRKIGLLIVSQVARDLRHWRRTSSHADNIYVSVNVSRLQILDDQFADNLVDMLNSFGIDPARINLEVTENAVMDAASIIVNTLRRLRAFGCGIMMDDFGTGHSSLSCLHRFPIDVLKIDRAFADSLSNSRDHAAVVQAIVTLAHNLNVQVVAEGVETRQHLITLQALSCDFAQGYLFSRPLSAAAAIALLAERPTWKNLAA